MTKVYFRLFTIVFILFFSRNSFAAFPINNSRLNLYSNSQNQRHERIRYLSSPSQESGSFGIISFVCGVIALPLFIIAISGLSDFLVIASLVFALAALIFGIIGAPREKPFRGLAVTGMILGLLVIPPFLLLLFILLII